MPEQQTTRSRVIDVVATVLLSIAVVLSAWSGYQAARWSGEQAIAFSAANGARVESTREATRAGQLQQIDVNTFIAWVTAYSEDNTELERFLFARFRPPMKVAVDGWVASDPLTNPDAASSPFALASYVLPEQVEAERLSQLAGEQVEVAKTDNQRSDNYVLAVVLFASVLFFAGIATKVTSERGQMALLGFGILVLVGTAAWMVTFPVSFGI